MATTIPIFLPFYLLLRKIGVYKLLYLVLQLVLLVHQMILFVLLFQWYLIHLISVRFFLQVRFISFIFKIWFCFIRRVTVFTCKSPPMVWHWDTGPWKFFLVFNSILHVFQLFIVSIHLQHLNRWKRKSNSIRKFFFVLVWLFLLFSQKNNTNFIFERRSNLLPSSLTVFDIELKIKKSDPNNKDTK